MSIIPKWNFTEKQDAVLRVLEENLEEGTYFVPRLPNGANENQQKAYQEERIGKPWLQSTIINNFPIIRG